MGEKRSGLGRLARRPVTAAVGLLLAYVLLSAFMDPHGYLGTDTGAKVATLQAMVDRGTADPDVGYWAGDLDPDGNLHPYYQAVDRPDGGWVAVTTLPMLEAARPLYAAGGYRAALLLPMLGAIGAAFAARSIARSVGATEAEGWTTFWLVGLASPITVYALDLWEHSLGVACMLGAVAALLPEVEARQARWRPLVAGALLGLGAAMRTETLVYGAVLVGTVGLLVLRRERSLRRPVLLGGLSIIGFAVPWLANSALEDHVGGLARASRAANTSAGWGRDLPLRAREAVQTLLGLNSGEAVAAGLLGLAVIGVVLAAMWGESRSDRRFAVVALGAAGLAYLAGAAGGLGFVSGLFPAFPIAIAALVQVVRRPDSRLLALLAVLPLPLVWLSQYTGGAGPQWGGRYTLTSAILLGIVGLVGLAASFPVVTRGLLVLSLGVTVLGVAWLGQRSHGVAAFFDDLDRDAAPVVISRQAFLLREGGPAALDREWLSVADGKAFDEAIDLVRAKDVDRFSVLEWGGAAPPADALPDDVREVDRRMLTIVGADVGLVTYEFTD